MIIKLELFGSSRDFSENKIIEFVLKKNSSTKDLRNELIDYLKKNFKDNKKFIEIVNSSVFCSEDNQLISDNYKITKNQKIGIIPPIGGG